MVAVVLHGNLASIGGAWGSLHFSVAPVGGAAIAGLVHLGLLLHAAGLAPLARATLSILGQMVVQQLRVGLLVSRQDMEERSWGVSRGAARGQWSSSPKS